MSTHDQCQFARDGLCEVSTLLVSLPVVLDEKACIACTKNSHPMEINSVTCSRAAWAARKSGLPVPDNVRTCIHESQKEGPGTELKKMLARFAKPTSDCGCNAHANMMNLWGPDGCEQPDNMKQIVGWLTEEAHKRWPVTKWVPKELFLQRLVMRAIKRARRKMLCNKSKNTARPAAGLPQSLA